MGSVSRQFSYRILIVDDDAAFSGTFQQILSAENYQLASAEDGFDALSQLRSVLPDIVICDLKMPRMSGFEFLSVLRRRFPQIPVIAMTGEFAGSGIPPGVIADAFFEKGVHAPVDLLKQVRELLAQSPVRAGLPKPKYAPVWVPLKGKKYFVVTCTECLRSFSVPMPVSDVTGRMEQRAACEFCGTEVGYLLDVRASASKRKPTAKPAQVVSHTATTASRGPRVIEYPRLRSGPYFADFRSDSTLEPQVVHCVVQRDGSPEILTWTQHPSAEAATAAGRTELQRLCRSKEA